MTLDRAAILGLVPHAGAMCLLDAVLDWDAAAISCLSRRFRDRDNPLRRADGRLGGAAGIEIAAQAMAVHRRLAAKQPAAPRPGYLVSVRDVRLTKSILDVAGDDLVIDATCLLADAKTAAYRFALSIAGVPVLDGRATVLLGA